MKNFMLFLMTLFLSCHVMAQQTTDLRSAQNQVGYDR